MKIKTLTLLILTTVALLLGGCVAEAPEKGKPTPEPTLPTPKEEANPDDIEWLAKVIASEAGSIYDKGNWVRCTDEERAAVGWTVLNRLDIGTFGGTIKEVTTAPGQYALNQDLTPEIRELAKNLLEGQISDPTEGATHFFSPISMPKEDEPTMGFDIAGGLHKVPGIDKNVYFPSWTRGLVWVGDLNKVRINYFMFYRPASPAPRSARILYVVDEECPYYTEDWLIHLEARGFQVDTVMVCNSSVDAELSGYDLVVVGYVLNSRVNVPIYTSIANSGLPILNGDQDLVEPFAQGTDTFSGVTTYGDSIHIATAHPLTDGYSGDVVCSYYAMYRNIIRADGIILGTATKQDQPPTTPGESAPPVADSVTGDVWSVKGNRIYFGLWACGSGNVDYWTFFDRSTDHLLGFTLVEAPSSTSGTLTADFTADSVEGPAPLVIHFTDNSTGTITN